MPRYGRRRGYYTDDYSPRSVPSGPPDHKAEHFASSREFAEWARTSLAERGRDNAHYYSGSPSDSYPRVIEGIRTLEEGDERNLPDAEGLLDQFNDQIVTPTTVWEHSVVGAFPDVQAYILGLPQDMYNQVPTTRDRSPLRAWIGLTSSSGVSEDQLRQRGIVLSAFAIAMQNIRPVYISPYVNMGWWDNDAYRGNGIHTSLISWDIQTNPLIMAELLGCTSRPEVTRYLGITACNLLNPNTTGLCNPVLSGEPNMRKLLNAAPDDLFLGQIHLYDPMLADPLKWLHTHIERYSNPDPERED